MPLTDTERRPMTDLDEWRRERVEMTEWDYARTDDPRTYADVIAADGCRP